MKYLIPILLGLIGTSSLLGQTIHLGTIYNYNTRITGVNGVEIHVKGDFINQPGTFNPSSVLLDGTIFCGGDFINNESNHLFEADSSSARVVMNGDTVQHIVGDTSIIFQRLVIDNSFGVKNVHDIVVRDSLSMIQGDLEMVGGSIDFENLGQLAFEREESRVFGLYGVLKANRSVTGGANNNIAGLGISIEGNLAEQIGFRLERGHLPLTNVTNGSIDRYYRYLPNVQNFEADITLNYLDAEIRTQSESQLDVFHSEDGIQWRRQFTDFDTTNDQTVALNQLINNEEVFYTFAESLCDDSLIVDLGTSVQNVCNGDTLILSVPLSGLEYLWSTGDTTQGIKVFDDQIVTVEVTNINGCVGRDTVEIINRDLPQAQFDIQAAGYCQTDSILLSNNSIFGNSELKFQSWQILFDSIQIGSDQSIFQFLSPQFGDFEVQLNIETVHGCTDSLTKSITIHEVPVADFLAPDHCLQEDFEALNISSHSTQAFSSLWYVNNEEVATTLNYNDRFEIDGEYEVALEITSLATGCKDSFTQVVTVYPLPEADFKFDPFCESTDALFINESNLNQQNIWYFNEQQIAATTDLNHTINDTLLHQLKLVVVSEFGCNDSITQQIKAEPIPYFQLFAHSGCQNEELNFTLNNNSSARDITYEWDLDDDQIANQQNTFVSYQTPGNKVINLTAATNFGCSFSIDTLIEIYPTPIANYNWESVCAQEIFKAKNLSQIAYGNFTTEWDLDTVTKNETDFEHLLSSGDHQLKLKITSDFACQDSIEQLINIHPHPELRLPDTTATCENRITLDAENFGSSFKWSDGSNSQQIIATRNGVYRVTATNAFGCSNEDATFVQLYSEITIDLGPDSAFCDSTNLIAFHSANASYNWSTGATTSSIKVFESDRYSVTVTDENGCTGAGSINLVINNSPNITLPTDFDLCDNETVVLTLDSLGQAFRWNTGEQTASITVKPGFYRVTVTNIDNCSSTDEVRISALSAPKQYFANEQIIICDSTALIRPLNNDEEILWFNGSNSEQIQLFESSIASNIVTNTFGCTVVDTAFVTVNKGQFFDLGADQLLCEGNQFTVDLSGMNADVQWNDGNKSKQRALFEQNVYWVDAITPEGCVSSDTIKVDVDTSIQTAIDPQYILCDSALLLFTADKDAVAISWYINDLEFSTDEEISINQIGNYRLEQISSNGCLYQDSFSVIGTNSDVFAEFLSPSLVNLGDTIQFVQVHNLEGITSSWSFGDGTSSNERHPNHRYFLEGDFDVQLIVENEVCSDTAQKIISVRELQDAFINNGIQLFEIKDLKVFPNPTYHGSFNITAEFSKSVPYRLLLVGQNGIIHYRSSGTSAAIESYINVPSLNSGLYYLILDANGEQRFEKIVFYD